MTYDLYTTYLQKVVMINVLKIESLFILDSCINEVLLIELTFCTAG